MRGANGRAHHLSEDWDLPVATVAGNAHWKGCADRTVCQRYVRPLHYMHSLPQYTSAHAAVPGICRFEDVFPGTPYDLVVDTMGGDYELRR